MRLGVSETGHHAWSARQTIPTPRIVAEIGLTSAFPDDPCRFVGYLWRYALCRGVAARADGQSKACRPSEGLCRPSVARQTYGMAACQAGQDDVRGRPRGPLVPHNSAQSAVGRVNHPAPDPRGLGLLRRRD